MKINASTVITDLAGNPVFTSNVEANKQAFYAMLAPDIRQKVEAVTGQVDMAKAATLGYLAIEALLAVYPGEDMTGDDKVKRFRLASLLADGGIVTLETEQVAELKRLIGKAFAPLLVGRAYDIIENGQAEG